MRTLAISVLSALALVGGAGCKGRGGGDGGTPTDPPVPPTVEAHPVAVVQGSFVGLFDATVGLPQFPTDFSGSRVQVLRIDGIGDLSPRPESDVGPDNTFRIENVPVGNGWVFVFGPNHERRLMRWAIREGINTFEGIDLLNNPDWNARGFVEMFLWARKGLLRWNVPAEVVVVSPNIDAGEVTAALAELTEMTRGGFSGSVVARRPTASEREAIETGCDYSGTAALGKVFVGQGLNDEAFACLAEDGREVLWARVRVTTNRHSVLHGMGHAAGARHPCTFPRTPDTLMGGDCDFYEIPAAPDWTDFDRQAFLFAYSRPGGTFGPDDSRQVDLMFGTVTNN